MNAGGSVRGAWWYHVLLALVVCAIVAVARTSEARYEALMQEDRSVEWATVWFFLVAAVVGGWRAIAERRIFDGLVALFCLFVAGEEFSWGQRLLGFTAPAYFLEHNRQQELTIHNFADVFGQPKWVLTFALAGYGVLLPVVAATRRGRRLLDRLHATAPPLALLPWFLGAVILLVWYPLSFTGEWVELVAGMLFAMAIVSLPSRFAALTAVGAVFAAGLTWWSGRALADPALLACAEGEVAALATRFAARHELRDGGSFHKRVWTAHEEGRIDLDSARADVAGAQCPAIVADATDRRRFAIDPWGTAYWIRYSRARQEVIVYSFGPNRRRDDGADDVLVSRPLQQP